MRILVSYLLRILRIQRFLDSLNSLYLQIANPNGGNFLTFNPGESNESWIRCESKIGANPWFRRSLYYTQITPLKTRPRSLHGLLSTNLENCTKPLWQWVLWGRFSISTHKSPLEFFEGWGEWVCKVTLQTHLPTKVVIITLRTIETKNELTSIQIWTWIGIIPEIYKRFSGNSFVEILCLPIQEISLLEHLVWYPFIGQHMILIYHEICDST